MNILKTIKDSDLGLTYSAPDVYIERKAARGIIFDKDKHIALLHVSKYHYHKLPGGGVEEGEDLIEAFKRETMEEIGCNIGNIKELAAVEEYRNKFTLHQMSYCFIANVAGEKGLPNLEESEIEEGYETVWLSLDEAIRIIGSETQIEDYEGKFIQLRDLALLKQAKAFLSTISL